VPAQGLDQDVGREDEEQKPGFGGSIE
jgi:hypothetical protein